MVHMLLPSYVEYEAHTWSYRVIVPHVRAMNAHDHTKKDNMVAV